MSKDYNAKYDGYDVNGRDVIEAGGVVNGYNAGPDYTEKKDVDYADDYGKHAIVSGVDKTGPAFADKKDNIVSVDHGKEVILVDSVDAVTGPGAQ